MMSNKNRTCTTLVVVGLLLMQLACQTLTGPRSTQPPVLPVTAAPSTAPPLTVVSPAAQPIATGAPETTLPEKAGQACFGSFDYGITCIENNEWVNYSQQNGTLSDDMVKDIAICLGGEILVLNTSGVHLFDGTNWRNYGQGWGYGSAEAIACGVDNDFWVAHYQGISHFDGTTWHTYTVKGTLSADPEAYELVNDIAIAPDGAVWVVTVNGIAVFAGEKWTVYEEGTGFDDQYFFERIAFDSKSNPWVISSSGLHHHNGLSWDFYPSPDYSILESVTVDGQDRVWVGTYSKGLLLYENEGWLTFTPQNSALASYEVNALAVDTADRIWVGTTWGLHIIDGETWTSYQMSNSDLADDNIVAIAVAGAGPALPTAQQKAPGTIKGQLIDVDGTPLANAAIEVCVETIFSSYGGTTPCEGHPYTHNTASDADGAFTVENLPAGFYNLAIQTGEIWLLYTTRSLGSSERFLVLPGETIDLGEIIVGQE
jgi:hypothetical protein